jgi:exonuclease SbcC
MERKQDIDRQIEEHHTKLEELGESREETEERIASLEERIKELKDVEARKRRIESSMEELNVELKGIMAETSREETGREYLLERIQELKKEIEAIMKAKDFEENLSAYESWIEGYLMNLADTIEKHYMIEIRRQFEPLFQDWFSLLMEDEDLSVKVDQEFTPIIEQQGYEAEFENLSGGESTSVALAYRLALNKVINTMVEGIQTKDVIVLDEPTDGFSENQLDKIGEVLDQLGIPQTIIVSHEPKIESYVDSIVYVDKEGGLSKIRSKAT